MNSSHYIRLFATVILLASCSSAWKTDLMGDCSQEDSNKMDQAFGEIFLFGELEREMIKDLASTSKWCR